MLGESKTMAYGKHIDEKWQKRWEEEKLYRFDPDKDNKLYCLEMFSYPSGAQLHVGHWYNYGLADILSLIHIWSLRNRKMKYRG